MSGIYLIVWDEKKQDKSDVLFSTKGGYPHVTIAYTGKELSANVLKQIAAQIFQEYALENITLERAEVNSFQPEKGPMRHDVLLITNKIVEIEQTREKWLRSKFANHDRFHMGKPHVTFGIYENKEKAEEAAQYLNQNILPYNVCFTGVTID